MVLERSIYISQFVLLFGLALFIGNPAVAEVDSEEFELLDDSGSVTLADSIEPKDNIDVVINAADKDGEALDEPLVEEGVYQIKFGGWSDHYISGNASNYDFNESHEGLGFAYSYYDETSERFFNGYNYEFWYMKDSFYKDNIQASYGIFHRKLLDNWGVKSIDVGINFAAISRSTADIDTNTAELKNHERLHTLMLIPSLSVYTKYKFHLDFVFLPAIPNVSDYSVLFFRAGFNL